jgi:hypothetical protein
MHLASTKSHIFVLRHWEVIRQTYLHISSELPKKKKKKKTAICFVRKLGYNSCISRLPNTEK